MSAAPPTPGDIGLSHSDPFLFWIKRDRWPHLRLIRGSISFTVPDARREGVLGSDCEDWCYDNLREGLLAEWRGLELIVHFASAHDAVLFKLKWL